MSGNIEDDLFYDLFGEDGFLTPGSTGSTDQDSGHGSPFGSNFDASPQQSFGWETTDPRVGELWGSILDDLPSEITDDSDSNDNKSPLSSSNDLDEPFPWSTKVLEESTSFDCNSNSMNIDSDWNFSENSLYNVKDSLNSDCVPVNINYNNINSNGNKNTFPINISPVTKPEPSSDVASQNELEFQPTQPIVIKAATKGGPTWVVKTSDIKSHFQIGQNIVAIIQSVNANELDKTLLNIGSTCENSGRDILTCDSFPVDKKEDTFSHVEHSDHDYADKEMPLTRETTGVSKGMGPGLVLTDEEKKLLELESLTLPEDAPLTKEEEKILKKVRRKIKNKQSAMESRRKRKEYIDNLERRVKHCTDLNHGLRKKVDKLTKENKSLVNQLKAMREFIAASFSQTKTASTGTCLAVLLFSFALLALPFNPFSYYEGKHDSTLPTETPNPTAMFRSRTLLAVEDNADYVYHDNELNTSYYSISNDNYLNEQSIYTDSVKIHFGSFGNNLENELLLRKANISMYIHENSTWYGTLNDKHYDKYINS